jgi:hypothetical protein
MGYVIAAIVVLLIVAGFVTFVVLNSMRKGSAKAEDEGTPGIGQDETPLGDTTEHAGDQTEQGTTAREPEQGRFDRDDPDAAAHRARPGEGEGEERLEFDDERPASERLANRDD